MRFGNERASAELEPREWEGEMIGKPVYSVGGLTVSRDLPAAERAVAARSLFEELSGECRRLGGGLCWARIDSTETDLASGITAAGFKQIETYLTFSHDLRADLPPRPASIRPARESDADALRKIGRESFQYSRFHMDPEIPKAAANRSREEWVVNGLRGRADEVLVAEVDGKVAGFVVCKSAGKTVSALDLIAVDKMFQGRGIGYDLTIGFLHHAQSRGRSGQVGTQDVNIASVKLYEKAGFKLTKMTLTFHKHF